MKKPSDDRVKKIEQRRAATRKGVVSPVVIVPDDMEPMEYAAARHAAGDTTPHLYTRRTPTTPEEIEAWAVACRAMHAEQGL